MADGRQAGSLVGTADREVPSGGTDRTPLAGHLLRLPAVGWAVWRCVGLSAGFPIARVLTLAREECAAAADALPELTARGPETETWARYRQEFAAAVMSLSADLRAVADPRFREALIWQNRSAWHTGIGNFASSPKNKPRGTMVRRNEEGVATLPSALLREERRDRLLRTDRMGPLGRHRRASHDAAGRQPAGRPPHVVRSLGHRHAR